ERRRARLLEPPPMSALRKASAAASATRDRSRAKPRRVAAKHAAAAPGQHGHGQPAAAAPPSVLFQPGERRDSGTPAAHPNPAVSQRPGGVDGLVLGGLVPTGSPHLNTTVVRPVVFDGPVNGSEARIRFGRNLDAPEVYIVPLAELRRPGPTPL